MKNLRCKFIVLFLICSGSLFSQTYSLGNQSKWNQLSNVLVSCDLNLLKDNRYYILLSVGTSELVQNIFPSYGFFHKEGNMYYLQDIPSGANIVLEEINHSNLIVRKGFSFMENELFFYENDADDSFSYLLDFKDRCESVRTYSLESKDKKNIEIQPLPLGTYRNGFVSLFLDLDFCYKIYYLLDGYSCLGNYILLYTISKIIKGHMIMYPFIIQSFFSFFFPFPSFLTLQERVFRKRGSRGSVFGL